MKNQTHCRTHCCHCMGLLLLVTLITAFINTDSARTLFNGLIFTDIIFPIVIYAMMLVYRILSHKSDD